jgi:CHAT domain-containing protein
LLHAGAKAVLLSLWDVQDESTAAFMTAFYEAYSTGRTAAEACGVALRGLRLTYNHPYYWAPFHLVGNWNVRV